MIDIGFTVLLNNEYRKYDTIYIWYDINHGIWNSLETSIDGGENVLKIRHLHAADHLTKL